jgi:hypothetical protein
MPAKMPHTPLLYTSHQPCFTPSNNIMAFSETGLNPGMITQTTSMIFKSEGSNNRYTSSEGILGVSLTHTFSTAIKCSNWHKIEGVPCPVVEFAKEGN